MLLREPVTGLCQDWHLSRSHKTPSCAQIMLHWLYLGIGIACMAVSWSAPVRAAAAPIAQVRSSLYVASKMGAALDSDLNNGGGSDDTTRLQAVLDQAKTGKPVHLLVDGAALVTGLTLYSNTTLECAQGGGLFLKTGSNRAILRNAHRTRDKIIDQYIEIRGCFINGNSFGQQGEGGGHPGLGHPLEKDGSFLAGLQFYGVRYFTMDSVTLWRARSFSSHIANAEHVTIRNVTIDIGIDKFLPYFEGASLTTDGLHFNGPVRYLHIDGVSLRTPDDGIALNANDGDYEDQTKTNYMGPYVGQGPIEDVTISNIEFIGSLNGMRILSSTARVDRISVNNVVGTYRNRFISIGRFTHDAPGNIGAVTISNVLVDPLPSTAPATPDDCPETYKEACRKFGQEIGTSLFTIDGKIEYLALRNVVTKPIDKRPLIWLGKKADISRFVLDLTLIDPVSQALPIKLEAGAHIREFGLNLDWIGRDPKTARKPIESSGGIIDYMTWSNEDIEKSRGREAQ